MVGRKRIAASRVMIRINPGDRELIDEICEETGATLSELCRHWIADRAAAERMRHDNAKAVKLMEGLFTKMQDEMLQMGMHPDKVAEYYGLELSEPQIEPARKARPSNTGPNVSLLRPAVVKQQSIVSPLSSSDNKNKTNKNNNLDKKKQGR